MIQVLVSLDYEARLSDFGMSLPGEKNQGDLINFLGLLNRGILVSIKELGAID